MRKRETKKRPTILGSPSHSTRSDIRTIYVHGIGQHPPADAWKSQWDLALFGRPMKDATIGAYWADILHADQYTLEAPP